MNILIVEDDILTAKLISHWVGGYLQNSILEVVTDFEYAKARCAEQQFDLIFLDLNLSGKNGFDILSSKKNKRCEIVVITASHDKALDAYDYSVLDFVLKPIDERRLKKAIDRFLQVSSLASDADVLTTKYGGFIKNINIEEIFYIKADGHYCQIFNSFGDGTLYHKPMEELLDLLPKYFVRIHRSYIINKNKLTAIKTHGAGKYSAIIGSFYIPMSRVYYLEKYKTI